MNREDPGDETATGGGDRMKTTLPWSALPILVPAIAASITRMKTIDLAYQLRVGEEILDGRFPRAESWTFSANGSPWVDQQWGAQALLAAVHRLGGWGGIATFRVVLVAVSFWLVYLACRNRGATPRTASLLTLVGYFVAQPTLAMRPQLIAVPLFALALWAVTSRRDYPVRLWLVPVAALVGVNVHGSFLLLPLLIGLAVLDDVLGRSPQLRRTAIVAASTVAVTVLNPFGVEVWRYAWELSNDPVIRTTIREWAPVSMSTPAGWLLFGSAVPLAVFLARRDRAVPWIDLITLVVFFALALLAARSLLWWGMVAPVVTAAHVPVAHRGSAGSPKVAAAFSVALATIALALLPAWRDAGSLLALAPPGVARTLGALPEGARVLAPQPLGSWIEFSTPQVRTFVDSRIELFGEDVWDAYRSVADAAAPWRETLDGWKVEVVVAEPDWDVVPLLRADAGWILLHEDEDAVIFGRR